MNPYEELGLDRDCTPAQIKRAYRHKSTLHHPDIGGDREKFEQVMSAYHILSDPARRKRYDRTGRIDDSPVTSEAIQVLIRQAVQSMIEGPGIGRMDDPVWDDIRTKVLYSIHRGRREVQNNMAATQRKRERVERLRERFKSKTDSDPVGEELDRQKKVLDEEALSHENALEMSQELEKIFKSYDYEVGPGPEGHSPSPTTRLALGRGTRVTY